MNLPETPLSRTVDPWLVRIGDWVSWTWLILLCVIVANVVLRYVFDRGRIEFEEIQWHLYSFGFLIGLGYAYQSDDHIRVDVLHERLQPRTRAWIELYGTLLFLLPFVLLVLIYSVPFINQSFQSSEVSSSPGGLAFRWAIKACLPLGFLLLFAALLSRLSRVWAFLFFSNTNSDQAS